MNGVQLECGCNRQHVESMVQYPLFLNVQEANL